MTLRQFYEQYFLPAYLRSVHAKPVSIAEYQSAIARWGELTEDPPLHKIDRLTCAKFVETDLNKPGRKGTLSPNTVRKHCTHLQMVLNLAGPQTKDCPDAATEEGLFGHDQYGRPRSVPWFKKPEPREKLPTDGFELDEIRKLLKVCDQARVPLLPSVRTAEWWRRLFRFEYNSGIRIGTTISLRKGWLREVDGAAWFEVPGEYYKGGKPHFLYCPPAALEIVHSMPTRDVIWPWPHTMKHLHSTRRELLAAAGIPHDRRFGFHGFRKAIGTEVWKRDPKAAQLLLGHKDEETTRGHYVNPNVLGLALAASIAPAMADIPQP